LSNFADYLWLVSDPEANGWLQKLAGDSRSALQQANLLRRALSAGRARLIAEQVELRRKAEVKFGELARVFFFTPTLLEQATDVVVSGYKAARFMRFGDEQLVHDYCCGLGGDAAPLSTRGPTIAWDLSDVACLLASANLDVMGGDGEVRQADVAALDPDSQEMWHVDPDRRSDARRSITLERHSPQPEVIDRWLKASPDGAVKLAPASAAPEHWEHQAELEWITSGRECRQQIAWFGKLAAEPPTRRATRLVRDAQGGSVAGSITGAPNAACDIAEAPGQFLGDPDPAVLAAKLLGEFANNLGLATLGLGGAYLTSDAAIAHPLLQSFAVMESMPLRPERVGQALAQRGVGRLELKKRGVAIDPEKFRRELKLRGDNEATVVLTRIGKREIALICERRVHQP
jgi:hypothetical protein